jgi:hypothetical protein
MVRTKVGEVQSRHFVSRHGSCAAAVGRSAYCRKTISGEPDRPAIRAEGRIVNAGIPAAEPSANIIRRS